MEPVWRIKQVVEHISEGVERGKIKPLHEVPIPQMNAIVNVRTWTQMEVQIEISAFQNEQSKTIYG